MVLNGKVVFKDVIYAKDEGGKVTAKSILGESREYGNCRVEEVDVNTTRLVLSTIY